MTARGRQTAQLSAPLLRRTRHSHPNRNRNGRQSFTQTRTARPQSHSRSRLRLQEMPARPTCRRTRACAAIVDGALSAKHGVIQNEKAVAQLTNKSVIESRSAGCAIHAMSRRNTTGKDAVRCRSNPSSADFADIPRLDRRGWSAGIATGRDPCTGRTCRAFFLAMVSSTRTRSPPRARQRAWAPAALHHHSRRRDTADGRQFAAARIGPRNCVQRSAS